MREPEWPEAQKQCRRFSLQSTHQPQAQSLTWMQSPKVGLAAVPRLAYLGVPGAVKRKLDRNAHGVTATALYQLSPPYSASQLLQLQLWLTRGSGYLPLSVGRMGPVQ